MKTAVLAPLVALAVLARSAAADNLSPGGSATRYWDCCRPSGAVAGKANVSHAVNTCAKDGRTLVSGSTQSACAGGTAYACYDAQPFVSSSNGTLSYAFGARAESNDESTFECACYALTFSQLPGKTLVVQATNDGGDVPATNFDIQIPGGGVGAFDACSTQWGVSNSELGAQYGGVSSRSQCANLPAAVQPGCEWRFDWLTPSGGDPNANPTIASIERVACPSQLTSISGCKRADDGQYPAAPQ